MALSGVTGFQQVSAAELAAAFPLAVPAGTERAWIQAEGANVRWRADGTSPTAAIGNIIFSGAHQPLELSIAAGLRTAKFILETGSPKLNIHYFGTVPNS